jgi:hypothetical protein
MQRGKGWAKQQGAKGEGSEGVKDKLKIYYNSLINNVLHPVGVKTWRIRANRTVQ